MTYTYRNDHGPASGPDEFLNIVREVADALVAEGRTLWEPATLTPENLFDEHTTGNCYVMYADGMPAATFILQWYDELYWPDVPPDTSGHIHKVAIRRAFGGQGLFGPMLEFCKAVCLERGIHEIRLDTEATRPKLMAFYERYGFEPVRRRWVHEFGQSFDCQFYVLAF